MQVLYARVTILTTSLWKAFILVPRIPLFHGTKQQGPCQGVELRVEMYTFRFHCKFVMSYQDSHVSECCWYIRGITFIWWHRTLGTMSRVWLEARI